MENFCFKEVLPNYIIYSRKEKYAYCTFCQKETTIDFKDTRPKMIVRCPQCKCEAFLKAKGQTKNVFIDWGCGIFLDRDDDQVVVRYFNVSKWYNPDGTIKEYDMREMMREWFDKRGFVKGADRYYSGDRWMKLNIRKYANYKGPAGQPCYHINLNWTYRKHYTKNIAKVIKGTIWEKSCMAEIFKLENNSQCWDTFRYFLMDYILSPVNEYLYKVGFLNILERNVFSKVVPFDMSKKSLNEILRISKKQYKRLLQIGNPTYQDLEDSYLIDKYGFKSVEDFKIWKKYFYDEFTDYYRWTPHNPAEEIMKLFPKSWQQFDKYASQFVNFSKDIYRDYLKMSKELGYDLRNSFVLFPKDLMRAEQNVTMEWNLKFNPEQFKKARERNTQYEKLKDKYIKKYEYEQGDLKVIVPNSCEDICLEGQILHHCVGSYIDRVCKKQSIILFVRKVDELDSALYTMEIANNRIIQCRGYRNGAITHEAKKFLDDFARKKKLMMDNIRVA